MHMWVNVTRDLESSDDSKGSERERISEEARRGGEDPVVQTLTSHSLCLSVCPASLVCRVSGHVSVSPSDCVIMHASG